MIVSGIYQIINKINKKSYTGSSQDIQKRWKRHRYELTANRHHCIPLQRAWLKYGADNFEFKVLEPASKNLFIKEDKWLAQLKPEYNIGAVGGGDNISNHPNLKGIKEKHSINLKNRWKEPEFREQQIKRLTGKSNPNWRGGSTFCECGNRISTYSSQCIECTDRSGNKNSFFGKRHSDKSKEKIRKARLGSLPPNARPVKIEGKQYASTGLAAKAIGVCGGTILFRIKSKYWDYAYVNQ